MTKKNNGTKEEHRSEMLKVNDQDSNVVRAPNCKKLK